MRAVRRGGRELLLNGLLGRKILIFCEYWKSGEEGEKRIRQYMVNGGESLE